VRIFRSIVVGAVALATVAVIPSGAATASPTSPPYNAYVLDGGTGSYLLSGIRAYNATNATITAQVGYDTGFIAFLSGNDGFSWHVIFKPPTSGPITIGTTYPTVPSGATATHGWMVIGGDGRGCGQQYGFMTVNELVRDPETGNPTSLAATFSVSCESQTQVLWGEVRLNSSIPASVVTPNPTSVDYGAEMVGRPGEQRTVTYTAAGSDDSVLGAASIVDGTMFTITGNTCSNTTLVPGATCTINVRAYPTAPGPQFAKLKLPVNSLSGAVYVPLTLTGERDNAGTYYPLTPARILDTRGGFGAPGGPVGTGGTINLQVAGRGGVPATGASAVVLNVTVTSPTSSGHITVWPTGVTRPTASSLNFVAGWTGANSVTVALGSGGSVSLFNSLGNTHLVADVVGYYAKDNALVSSQGIGGEFQPVQPERLFDSRVDWGEKLPGGFWVEIPVSYGTTYNPRIRALAVNVTAVNGEGNGYLMTFSGSGMPPPTSTLNFTPVGAVPNFAVVPTSFCYDCGPGVYPMIAVYTNVNVDVIVDIIGFYDDGQLADGTHDGLRFTPMTPTRITDSRIGQGMPGALGQQATVSLNAGSLPPATVALSLNVTAVSPTVATFISVWPNGLDRPTVSTLNPERGQIVPNATPVLLGDGDLFNVYNNAGSTHLVVDMVGTFYFLPALGSLSGSSQAFNKADGDYARTPRVTKLKATLHNS
jgi:hypothetical protein